MTSYYLSLINVPILSFACLPITMERVKIPKYGEVRLSLKDNKKLDLFDM